MSASPTTTDATPSSAATGSTPGAGEPAERRQPTSSTSDAPSPTLRRRWREPSTLKEFASQARSVATMLLNGEIDLDTARSYSGIARTIAQAAAQETMKARLLQAEPDLTFEDEVYDDAEV
jgi:hypothetical protein